VIDAPQEKAVLQELLNRSIEIEKQVPSALGP
jgi:hypothetical protein